MNSVREVSNSELRWFHDQLQLDKAKRLAHARSLVKNAQAFNLNPAITPIPPSGNWVYGFGGNFPNTQTATTAGTTAMTAMTVGTSMLVVGQPVGGTNIAVGTTIAAIVSATAITLSIAATGSGTQAVTFGNPDPFQNAVFGGNAFFGQPNATALAADIPGCLFAIPEAQTIVFGTVATGVAVFIPAPGEGYLSVTSGATTGSSVQIQTGPVGTWTTIYGPGTVSTTSTYYVTTDGANLRVTSPGTTSASFVFYRFRGKPQL